MPKIFFPRLTKKSMRKLSLLIIVLAIVAIMSSSLIMTSDARISRYPHPTPTPQPAGANVVQNGDFESGISPWTLGLSDPQSQGYAGTLTRSSNAYSGSYCGLFTVTGNPQGGSGFIDVMQTIPAQVGHTYTLQLFYKGTMIVGPHVFFFGSSWNNLGMSAGSALLPANAWTPMSMTFSVPSGTAVTEIHFDVGSTGVFQVDNVTVTDPTPSPSPTPTATPTPTLTPTPSPSPTPTPTATPTPTPSPIPSPSPSSTPKPTATPTPTPSPTPTGTPTGTNVVQNGDFESGISPWTLGLSDPQSQGYAGTLTRSSNAYSGSYCGLFTVTGNPQGGSGFIDVMQTIPAQVGHTYTLQLFYKGTMIVGPHVFFFGSSWNNLGMSAGSALLPANAWTPMSMTFSVPSGTAVTEIHFDVGSTGVFQVDNVTVTDPTPSPSPTPTATPTPTLTPTPSPSPTPTPTATPTPTPSPAPIPTYSYIISVSGSNYQMKNGTTQQIIYQSTNAAQVINNAITQLTFNQKICFTSGTYTLTASAEISNKDNGALIFEPGAKLFIANNMGKSAIFIHDGCDNWLIDGVEIDGNAANQNIGGWSPPDGIAIYNNCNNITTINANIHDLSMYGWVAWEGVTNCGIRDSTLINCNWNCIQLGNSVQPTTTETGLYAINNTCVNSGDVGITTYGIGNLIQGNKLYNMTGTKGSVNSQWGIGVEGGHGHTITGNTLINCPRAIDIEVTDGVGSNTITNNIITTCAFGIVLSSPNNTIENNTIINFDMYGWGNQAIAINPTDNNKVLNNTISSANSVAHAMVISSTSNTKVIGNRIDVSQSANQWFSIQIVGTSINTQISQNTIIGWKAVIVQDATCQNTTITYNDFTHSNPDNQPISNSGTGTTIYGNLM